MRAGNNRRLPNSWLIGGSQTGEMATWNWACTTLRCSERKDGYLFRGIFPRPGSDSDDTPGFDPNNPESSMNARHIRAEQFMREQYGKAGYGLARHICRPLRQLQHKRMPEAQSVRP